MFWLSGWLRGWDIRPSSRKDSSELKERQQEALEKGSETDPISLHFTSKQKFIFSKTDAPQTELSPMPLHIEQDKQNYWPCQ
jgi:hypothetical protein